MFRIKTIAYKQIRILLVTTIITVALFLLMINYFQNRQLHQELRYNLQEMVDVQSHIVSNLLWNLELTSLKSQLDTVAMHPDVLYISVFDEQTEHLLESGDPSKKQKFPDLYTEIDLNKQSDGMEYPLGSMAIQFHSGRIEAIILDNFFKYLLLFTILGVVTLLVTSLFQSINGPEQRG